jgi:hypothetical protein
MPPLISNKVLDTFLKHQSEGIAPLSGDAHQRDYSPSVSRGIVMTSNSDKAAASEKATSIEAATSTRVAAEGIAGSSGFTPRPPPPPSPPLPPPPPLQEGVSFAVDDSQNGLGGPLLATSLVLASAVHSYQCGLGTLSLQVLDSSLTLIHFPSIHLCPMINIGTFKSEIHASLSIIDSRRSSGDSHSSGPGPPIIRCSLCSRCSFLRR